MNDENISEAEKDKMLSIGEVSEYLGVSIDTLRRWEKKGKVKAYRSPGNHRYFKKKDVDNLFGTKYERSEETKDRSTKTIEKETKKEEEIIPELQIFDRPPQPVNVPSSEPVRIISQQRWQSFKLETQTNQSMPDNYQTPQPPTPPTTSPPTTQSVLTPQMASEKVSRENSNIPVDKEKPKINNQKKNNLKTVLIVIGTIVILIIAIIVITRVLFPSEVLSPVPY